MDLFAHTTSLSRRQSAEVSLNYLGRLFDSNIELRLFLRHCINRITPSECHCNGVPTEETCKILKKFGSESFSATWRKVPAARGRARRRRSFPVKYRQAASGRNLRRVRQRGSRSAPADVRLRSGKNSGW